jgi:predicted TIM-barrel fold metal-dependent hydrolase
MQMNDMIIISTDDHIIEPPDLFVKTMPAKFKDETPRVMRYSDGHERWVIGDLRLAHIAPSAVAGRKQEEITFEPSSYSDVRKGVYDVHARVDDMDANGILSSLNFPNILGFAGEKMMKVKNRELALACIQAYNDWHVEQWAGAYPGRFIPVVVVPLWDVNLCVQEVRRMAKKGVRVVAFPENAPGYGLPSIHQSIWDPFFKEVVHHDMSLVVHIGTSGAQLAAPSLECPAIVAGTTLNMKIADSLSDFVFSPLPQKYPTLRIALSEGCMGWVPFQLSRMDVAYKNFGMSNGHDLGQDTPTSIVRRHFLFCFHDDQIGLKNRHDVGLNQITVEVDYPHADSTWPRTPEVLWRDMKDFPDEEINLITHGNAMRFFDFDPFKFIKRETATVGALRARAKAHNVDVSPQAFSGRKPDRTGVLTSGDLVRLISNMEDNLCEPVGVL